MQDTSKDLGYMRRDIRQIYLFEPVGMQWIAACRICQ